MENQHRKITGYRELNQDEIDLMNEAKAKGKELRDFVNQLRAQNAATGGHSIDLKWVEEAEMVLETGIMCLVRSIARPE